MHIYLFIYCTTLVNTTVTYKGGRSKIYIYVDYQQSTNIHVRPTNNLNVFTCYSTTVLPKYEIVVNVSHVTLQQFCLSMR